MDSLENEKQISRNNHIESNRKRLQSLKTLRTTYKNQKLIIQSALSNIDKEHNKIVFDNDFGKVTATDITEDSKVKNHGKILFEDESDDDDNLEIDFSVKKQFEGEEGQRLLELQSRYKNDKRFNLDERFLNDQQKDDTNENGVSEIEGNVDTCLEKEKKRELEILGQVLEKHNAKMTKNAKSKVENKFMVRFDPSQPQHSKYEMKKEGIQTKKTKTKSITEVFEEKKSQETVLPEVSKEMLYQVKGNLKNSLHGNKQVSLLSMFGRVQENGDDDMEVEETEIKISKSQFDNINPFKYDSSDEEEKQDVSSKDEKQQYDTTLENGATTNKRSSFWVESFFFKEDDYRLQEGFDFIEKIRMEDSSEFTKSRRELKKIVKMKVRNVLQKKKPFKRKLGGSKRRKDIKLKKAMKK